jgi:hypothetical protein
MPKSITKKIVNKRLERVSNHASPFVAQDLTVQVSDLAHLRKHPPFKLNRTLIPVSMLRGLAAAECAKHKTFMPGGKCAENPKAAVACVIHRLLDYSYVIVREEYKHPRLINRTYKHEMKQLIDSWGSNEYRGASIFKKSIIPPILRALASHGIFFMYDHEMHLKYLVKHNPVARRK